jgi:hypothetical protein
MIPNHAQFIEAIHAKKKVCVRFYSKADSGVIDLVCAPMDYGPGPGVQDGVNRYWLWDSTSNTGSPALGLRPEQILDVRVLGELFDPAGLGAPSSTWSISRDWGAPATPGTMTPTAGPAQTEAPPNSSGFAHLSNK